MAKCIICGNELCRVWKDDDPSMYCGECAEIRADAKGTITIVLPKIYLGDYVAAKTFDGARLCVHEDPLIVTHPSYHIPILSKLPVSHTDRSGAVASPLQLYAAALVIDDHLARKSRLLVHCHGGVERSPLLMAYYLTRFHQYMIRSMAEAYNYLKFARPVVADRTSWLAESN